ncbi:heavy metal-binding domain-containing protein [Methylococcus geothermalis]|uniref:heavy metal-binding domain-containing protein n=1 Tax=Methylococcus geothermalis TaxID=2681310 RepID=UPI001CB7270B
MAETTEPFAGERQVYTCPMHPEVVRLQPGHCPCLCSFWRWGMIFSRKSWGLSGTLNAAASRGRKPLLIPGSYGSFAGWVKT